MLARRSRQSRVIADPKRDFFTFFSQKTWKKTIFVHFSESKGTRYGQRFCYGGYMTHSDGLDIADQPSELLFLRWGRFMISLR